MSFRTSWMIAARLVMVPLCLVLVSGSSFAQTCAGIGGLEVLPAEVVAGNAFGTSIAMSGDEMVVGAPDVSNRPGSVYLFLRRAGVWMQQQRLFADAPVNGDRFGYAVGMEGSIMVVGAYGATACGDASGAAFVFRKSADRWVFEQRLSPPNCDGGGFGAAVAIAGEQVIVGAPWTHVDGSPDGTVHVYTKKRGEWRLRQTLNVEGGPQNRAFGTSIAATENQLLVGAPQDNDLGIRAGAAFAFIREGDLWTTPRRLVPSVVAAEDRFGSRVAVDAGRCAVSAYLHDGRATDTGAVFVFEHNQDGLAEQQVITDADGLEQDRFGDGLTLLGTRLVIGATGRRWFDGQEQKGVAYVYGLDGNQWKRQRTLLISHPMSGDYFGFAIAGSDDEVIVTSMHHRHQGFLAGGAFTYCIALPTGDVNSDGRVDEIDVLAAIASWGPCQQVCPADFDQSGTVDVADLLAIIGAWLP